MKLLIRYIIGWICIGSMFSCQTNSYEAKTMAATSRLEEKPEPVDSLFDKDIKTIHVKVALCDNKHQGIVPVPAAIGNGQDPKNNLYWGTAYGIKTYFKKSASWTLVKEYTGLDSIILERLVFKHQSGAYLIADAYDGRYIKKCTQDFLESLSGKNKEVLEFDEKVLGLGSYSALLAYIGHNGLMDFSLDDTYPNMDAKTRDAIVLACYSKHYFSPYISQAGAKAKVLTNGLMSPEAYTLHDVLEVYFNGGSDSELCAAAAKAYHKYQKCGLNAAKGLFACE